MTILVNKSGNAPWDFTGSVYLANQASGTQEISGTVFITGGLVTLGTGTNFVGFISGNVNTTITSVFVASGNIFVNSGNVTLNAGTNYIGQVSGNASVLGSVAVTTNPLPVSGDRVGLADRSGVSIYFDSSTLPNWRGVGSAFIAGGSLNITNAVGSVAVTTDPLPVSGTVSITGGRITLGTGTNFIGNVSGNQSVLGSVAITTSPVPASGPIQLYGMGTGTTTWLPAMTLSGTAGTPQPLVASVSVDKAFIPSGNIYIQSGANWTGVGSVFVAGGSSNINNPQLIGSLATQGILGSVAITNKDPIANNYRTFMVNISGTAQNTAVSGANFPIYWVKLLDYRGSDSSFSGTFAITGTYLKIGSSNSDSIPLWTLTRPDVDLLWAGSLQGDIYVTHQAGPVGSPLVLLVGTL